MIKNNKLVYGLLILFVSFALSLNSALAQETNQDVNTQNSFTGKVVDASTNQPLPNVEVEIQGQNQTATTDQEGKFTFENLDVQSQGMGSGEIEIRINHEGYQELTETVSADELSQRGQERGQEREQEQQRGQQQKDVKTFELQPEEY